MQRLDGGVVLGGRYELGDLLGRGGMGEVRAGRDLRLGRSVAVKTLRSDLAEQEDVRRRFEGEARAAARLSHPNVVGVFDVGEEAGTPYIVMEQVTGPTLAEELAGGPLAPERALRLSREILAAVGAAHAAGIIHRDVKPANVLLAADGSAKVADFGIAKVTGDDTVVTRLAMTTEGAIGTVAYMAPERLHGRAATVESDLYSVGAILYESLSGTAPFLADTPAGLVFAISQGHRTPLGDLRTDLDPAVVAVVERSLAVRPEDRFVSAAEMAAALRSPVPTDAAPTVAASATEILSPSVLAGTSPAPSAEPRPVWTAPAPPAPVARPPAPPSPSGRRRRPTVVAVAVGLAALAGLAVGAIALAPEDDPATSSPSGTTVPPAVPDGAVPLPLDEALDRLEEILR